MIQIHSLQNAGWKLEKGLTLTLRLCSPLVLRFMGCDIGNEGEGKLAGKNGWYDYWSHGARGQ